MAQDTRPISKVVQQFDLMPDGAMVSVPDMAAILGIGVSTAWRRAKLEPDSFPQPIRLSERCTRARVGDIRVFLANKSAK